MKKIKLLGLSLLSGLIFSAAWPTLGFPLLIFIAFIPLLVIEDYIYKNPQRFNRLSIWIYTFPGIFLFNALTTWWIYYSTLPGAIMALGFNSLFMTAIFAWFHWSRKKFNSNLAYVALAAYWIAFEYLHLNWDLTWSWLNLGNVFSIYYEWVQWYEYTGVFGGAVWIFVVNYMLFKAYQQLSENTKENPMLFLLKKSWKALLVIIIPILVSYSIYFSYDEKNNPVNVTIVQPNIDPYNEKFSGMSDEDQLHRIVGIAREASDSSTQLIIGPETALPNGVWEGPGNYSSDMDSIYALLKIRPNASFLIGMTTFKHYESAEKATITARKTKSNEYYDVYNTAALYETNKDIQFYHKSKLVPGVEKMPFPTLLKPLESLAIDLGGTTGSYGIQEDRSVFNSGVNKKFVYGPIICYESIYGEFVTGYVKNGANLLVIITNDGWWSDSQGHKQHLSYASLRAIETRRSIARSANTGISAIINQRGDIVEKTKWWEQAAIKANININNDITVYVKYGDIIARIASLLAILLLMYSVYLKILSKIRK